MDLIGSLPAAPLARMASISFVEVSPSIEIILNVSSATSLHAFCRSSGAMSASVVTKQSIVAILGWIMPEPFAMPPIVHSLSPIGKRTATCLRFVSVVMIASAASPLPPVESDAASAGMASLIGPSGSGWPITPVEATTTSFAAIFSACAALLHIAAAISRPSALHVFALPELHKIARARPFCRCSRVTMSGAPLTLFCV